MRPMLNRLPAFLVAFCLCAGQSAAQAQEDPVFSGPQAGEALPELPLKRYRANEQELEMEFKEATASAKGRLIVFVHQVTRPSVAFARTLGRYAASRQADGLETAVVFLTDDSTKTLQWMQIARNALPDNVILAVSPDGLEGPGAYGLNRNVTLTVLVAKDD